MTGNAYPKFKLSLVAVVLCGSLQAEVVKEPVGIVPALQECRNINVSEQRLSCFDNLARRYVPPTYQGKLGKVTDTFKLKVPHILRYRSQGVIFVLYLRDGKGNVLQNLHIGGRGEDKYLISEPGEYSLKVDGSATWQIWLEPTDN